MAGVLQAAFEKECRDLLPPPAGVNLSYGSAALLLLAAFAAGLLVGAVLLGFAAYVAWRWWAFQPTWTPGGSSRLAGYRLD